MHLYPIYIINAMNTPLYPIVLAVLCASVSHRCCVTSLQFVLGANIGLLEECTTQWSTGFPRYKP